MFVIFTPEAQYVGCEICGQCRGPRELAPAVVFLANAKEFYREHRACEAIAAEAERQREGWPPAGERAKLGATHSFPARHRMPWEAEREPGEDG